MAAISTAIIAGIGLAVAGVGVFTQMQASKKAAKLSERQARLEARRQRRQAIREARIARAQVLNTGAAVGAGSSSAVAGGISSTGAQLGANLGFSSQTEQIGLGLAKAERKAAFGGALAGIGGSIFGQAGGFKAFKPVFSSPSTPTPFSGIRPGR